MRGHHQSMVDAISTMLRLVNSLIDFVAIGIQLNNLITKLR